MLPVYLYVYVYICIFALTGTSSFSLFSTYQYILFLALV